MTDIIGKSWSNEEPLRTNDRGEHWTERRRRRSWSYALLLAFLVAGCNKLEVIEKTFGEKEAIALVETYNQTTIEAFRTGDARLVEPVAGPDEATKLTGLIGVKLDMGTTLDSRLETFTVSSVEAVDAGFVVNTQERWSYADRKIGSGEQVGEGSVDTYAMAYTLKQFDGIWKVDHIEFLAPPNVGREVAPLQAPLSVMHGQVKPVEKEAE